MNILKEAKELRSTIVKLRRYLHQNPELSNNEFETSKFVVDKLKKLGLELQTGVGGTGVVGLLKGGKPGKTVALRADMDALPINEETGLEFSSNKKNVMHACGHDFHTSILIGAAIVLSQKRESLQGNIKFIFQPAEEKLIGASQMIRDNVLENPQVDAIMALHCWPDLPTGTIGVKRGEVMAAGDSLDITIKGKQGHAAHPHKAIDPITIASYVITKLQTIVSREIAPVDSVVISIGQINGGNAFNVIPQTVKMSGTVRVLNPEIRDKLPDMINRIVKKTAESMNGEAKVNYNFGSPPLINNDLMVDVLDKSVTQLLGNDNLVYMNTPSLGSEDFAFYLEKIPGVFFRLGTYNAGHNPQYPLHHPKVLFDEGALEIGISVISDAAFRFLRNF